MAQVSFPELCALLDYNPDATKPKHVWRRLDKLGIKYLQDRFGRPWTTTEAIDRALTSTGAARPEVPRFEALKRRGDTQP